MKINEIISVFLEQYLSINVFFNIDSNLFWKTEFESEFERVLTFLQIKFKNFTNPDLIHWNFSKWTINTSMQSTEAKAGYFLTTQQTLSLHTQSPIPMNQQCDFKNKTVVITGAGGAFGRAATVFFATFGANLCLLDANQTFLNETATLAETVCDRSKILTFVCDVRSESEVAKVVNQIEASFGAINHLFNNAGYQGMFEKTHNYSHEDFKRVFEINVFGAFNVMQACVRSMIKTGTPGSIVNVASEATSGAPNMVAYSASKGAVLSMTKTAAKDLAPYNIRINAISPCFIGDNKMWERQCELQARVNSIYYSNDPKEVAKQMIEKVPVRRVGSLEEVVSVTAFLLSDLSSYVIGQDIHINGGV